MIRHILCFGDSNTHGYCPEPGGCAEGGRFNEQERWTCLLQKALGDEIRICEEGLTGRTTAFDDPLRESMNGLSALYSCLMSHEPVDLMILMLGTNDVKDRFCLSPEDIAAGLEKLIRKAKSLPAWRNDRANILVVAPPHIAEERDRTMHEKSAALAPLYEAVALRNGCSFLDAEGIGRFNTFDYSHLTAQGHRNLAEKLSHLVPELLK